VNSPPGVVEANRSGNPAVATSQSSAAGTERATPPMQPSAEQLLEEQRARQLAEDETAIRGLLPQYVDAYQDKDEARLRRLMPGFRGIPNKELIRSVTVKLGEPRIVINGRSATLLVAQTLEYQWERAGLPPTGTGTVTWNLEKQGSTWTIVSSNFR